MTRYDVTKHELAEMMPGEPAYRSEQVWRGLHLGLSAPEELTVLPLTLRGRLGADARLAPGFELEEEAESSKGRTLRWLLRSTSDGVLVETVVMKYRDRSTVCISSQAGCAMACSFCATGQMGFRRHLRAGEITEQVVLAARACRDRGWGRLSNVVVMGMGEPLANYANVAEAIKRCNGELAIAARAFTLSTVGIVPGISRLAREPLQVNLAVSLHAARDELRSSIVPINRRYPLAQVMRACEDYAAKTQRRVSFEWALIAGVNDGRADSLELARLLRPLAGLAHVNLIPLNPTPRYLVAGSSRRVVGRFRDELLDRGVNVTVRDTRGQDVGGACGQLAGGAQAASIRRRV